VGGFQFGQFRITLLYLKLDNYIKYIIILIITSSPSICTETGHMQKLTS